MKAEMKGKTPKDGKQSNNYFRLHTASASASGAQPLRVLGMSGNLVKRKVTDAKEREKAIKRLERAMDSQVMPMPTIAT